MESHTSTSHLIGIDPVRVLLEREEPFPRQSLVSPLVEKDAVWNKAVSSFHRSRRANYQPFQCTLA